MTTDRLALRGVTVRRSGAPVVDDVDLDVVAGDVVALIGANGAGKTSLLEAISGGVASTGEIVLDGRPIGRLSRSRRARAGIAHVEQGRTIFGDMTVEQNLMIVADRAGRDAALSGFPELSEMRHRRAGLLSGGQQQMLVIARAIAQQPRYLLLDELSLGLAPAIVKRLLPFVRSIADRGVGVLLVEQFAYQALRHADHAAVLDRGRIVIEGRAADLVDRSDHLAAAYLGTPTTGTTSGTMSGEVTG
jgi:branched-chain amino acid transport system ATP-binding protein